MSKKIDMTGWIMKEHGVPQSLLTVIRENTEYKKLHNIKEDTYWDCICECGGTTTAAGSKLRATKKGIWSCGCLKKTANRKDLTGMRKGILTVLGDSGLRVHGNILWRCCCDCGNEVNMRGHTLLHTDVFSCGCINSKGEYKIIQLLTQNSIPFVTQKKYENLVSHKGYQLRFDFLINNEFLLEYDGEQHYNPVYYFHSSLNEQKDNDTRKNEYAKSHNIPLKRIPYWNLNKITLEDIMGDKYLVA